MIAPIELSLRWQVVEGDCLAVLPTLPAGCVDAVVTDPPYGISVAGAVSVGPTGSRNMDFFPDDSVEIAAQAAPELLRVLRRPGNVLMFVGHRQFGPVEALLRAAGMETRPFAWVKKCPVPAAPTMRWTSGFELAVYGFDYGSYFASDGAGIRPNAVTADSYRYGQPGKVEHPTQKPLGLMREIVRRLVPPGGLVLDAFAGSGSTGVAAASLGFRFLGIEREAKYVAIARARIAAEAAQGTLALGGA